MEVNDTTQARVCVSVCGCARVCVCVHLTGGSGGANRSVQGRRTTATADARGVRNGNGEGHSGRVGVEGGQREVQTFYPVRRYTVNQVVSLPSGVPMTGRPDPVRVPNSH